MQHLALHARLIDLHLFFKHVQALLDAFDLLVLFLLLDGREGADEVLVLLLLAEGEVQKEPVVQDEIQMTLVGDLRRLVIVDLVRVAHDCD